MDFAHFWPAFASGFAFFAGSVLTLFLLTLGRKEPTARAFSITTLCTALWGLVSFLYDTTPINQLEIARMWKGASQLFTATIAGAVSNFAVIYYREIAGNPPRIYLILRGIIVTTAGLLAIMLFSDILGFSELGIKEVVVGEKGLLEPTPGPLHHGVYSHFFAAAFFTGYVIWSVLKKNHSPIIKSQVRWIVSSLIIAMVAGGTRFAAWYHVPVSPNIAAFAAPAFGIGISYAIARHHLFNTRVIGTEILTVGIWVFLFFLVIFSSTVSERIVNSILFLAVVVLGTFLIRGTLREVGQKEELAKANTALKNLNQNLEEIVRERTGELSRAKLHTDAIIENLVLGLVEYKSDFTVLRVNKAAEELLGFNRSDVVGKKITGEDIRIKELSSLAEVIHLDSGNESLQNNRLPVPGVISETTIHHPSPKNLQIITFRVVSEEQNWTEERRQFVKIIRDITREKLIDKNKSDFITIVAHQLRTPLSAIKWVFNMALENKNALNTDHMEALRDGSQATERMIHLINDLLDVVSIEDGRFGYEFKWNDITKTIADVVGNMKARANWKKISFGVEFPPEPLPPLVFDESRISLALTNIIENAIDYTPENGSVRILVQRENNEIRIIVKDTGMGIQKNDMQKVLVTKFFRSAQAIGAQTDGSGLGLFISNNIIQSHKGTIAIESTENNGTTVSIAIPTTLSLSDTPKLRPQVQRVSM